MSEYTVRLYIASKSKQLYNGSKITEKLQQCWTVFIVACEEMSFQLLFENGQ